MNSERKGISYLSFGIGLLSMSISTIIISSGVAIGLGAFFALQKGEIINADRSFQLAIASKIQSIQNTILTTTRTVHTITSLFNISEGNIHPYDRFLPFMENSQSNISGVFSLGWIGRVAGKDRDTFVNSVREFGRDYASFNITTRNSQGNIIPMPVTNEYHYPMYYVYPLITNIGAIGFDISTEPVRRDALQYVILSMKDAVTSRVYLPHTKYQQPGVLYLSPLVNNTDKTIRGMGVGVFIIGDMISSTIADMLDRSIVAIFDRGITNTTGTSVVSITTDTWDNRNYDTSSFLWSNTGTYGPDFGSVEHIKTMRSISNTSPFQYSYSLSVGNRQWDIIFVPNASYLQPYQTGDKWIALICSIFGAITVCVCIWSIVIFLYMRWKSINHMHMIEIDMVNRSADNYRNLLNHVGKIEEAKKYILDAIPDIIIVVNKTQKIIYTNNMFESTLGYSHMEIYNGIYLKDLFLGKQLDLVSDRKHTEFVDGTIHTRLRNEIPVSYCYTVLDVDEAIFSMDNPSEILSQESTGKDYVYAFIIRDMRTSRALLDELAGNRGAVEILMKNSEFERRWESDKIDTGFRRQLLRFCQGEASAENVLFLQDIERYKLITELDVRIREQNRIIETYLSSDAENTLNVDRELITTVLVKSKMSIGDIYLFDNIVKNVKVIMSTDIYPRYRIDESRRSSTDTGSHDKGSDKRK